MRKRSRGCLRAATLVLLGLCLQGCVFTDYLFFRNRFVVCDTIASGQPWNVYETFLRAGLLMNCGVFNIVGSVHTSPGSFVGGVQPLAAAQLPSRLTVRMEVFEGATPVLTQDYKVKVKKNGTFDAFFDTPGSNIVAGGDVCKSMEFAPNSFLSISATPNKKLEEGAAIEASVYATERLELEECEPKVIKRSKAINRATWWRKPGNSTKKVVPSGVRIHCRNTTAGEHGSLRIFYQDGTIETIAFVCN